MIISFIWTIFTEVSITLDSPREMKKKLPYHRLQVSDKKTLGHSATVKVGGRYYSGSIKDLIEEYPLNLSKHVYHYREQYLRKIILDEDSEKKLLSRLKECCPNELKVLMKKKAYQNVYRKLNKEKKGFKLQ